MILFVLAALVLASVPLCGGSLHRLAELELHGLWLAPLAFAIQLAITTVAPGGSHALHAGLHLLTYVLLGACLWANRRLPGARLLALGCALNATAIAANGGVMPQSRAAHRLAGLPVRGGFQNSTLLRHPHLLWLGDVIPVPAPLHLANVLSVGDCVLFAGMAVLVQVSCGVAVGVGRLALPHRATLRRDAPPSEAAYADAVLTGALSALHAVLHLWRAGEPRDGPDARRAIAALHTCRRAADRLPGTEPGIGAAQIWLHRASLHLGGYAAGTELSEATERRLRATALRLADCRALTAQRRGSAGGRGPGRRDAGGGSRSGRGPAGFAALARWTRAKTRSRTQARPA
jgi:hypothetical protein